MFRYFPIWLREIFIDCTIFIVAFLMFVFCIAFACIVYRFIKFMIFKRKNNKKFIDFIKDVNTLGIIGTVLLSGLVVILFYLPQKVIPDEYNFNEISIRTVINHVSFDTVTVSEKDKLMEFRKLFSESSCKRALDSVSSIHTDSNTIFIDIYGMEGHKAYPMHFVVQKDYLIRYESGNINFTYTIDDDENKLVKEVFYFVNKHVRETEFEQR